MDSHHFNAGPDPGPAFHRNADSDPAFPFNADPVQILLLTKVIRICDHWSTDPPRIHFELSLHASIASIHGLPLII